MRSAILIAFVITIISSALIFLPEARARRPQESKPQESQTQASQPQESQEDLGKRIGTVIVTPGSGPSLAVADFQPRAGGLDASLGTYNDTLWNDLKFAGVANLVGKSLYPKTLLADPATLKYEEWADDPVKSDYVAFGNLTGANTAQGFLYDVKTRQQLLSAAMSGEPREMAHQFADQIVRLLTGQEGIAQSKIVYMANHEIYKMDYDGYGSKAITRDGSTAVFPSLSPDGKRLAYVSYRDGYPNIYIRGEDGLLIGSTRFKGTTASPAIGPDGQIAFASSKDGGSMDIYVASGDGSNAKRLTHTRNGVNISPRWNPKTGREIAFISDRAGSPRIYIIGADGSNERQLLPMGGHMDSPSWSPDGRYLAFTWDGDRDGAYNIYVADVASTQILKVTREGRNENPTWSPDSRHIAFQSNRSGRWEIWAMHIDGSEPRQLTRGGGRAPSWSR
ncbi:MAG TPA: translocation protein TolB [Blastocatellia bacterium]|jgi:TolB protein